MPNKLKHYVCGVCGNPTFIKIDPDTDRCDKCLTDHEKLADYAIVNDQKKRA